MADTDTSTYEHPCLVAGERVRMVWQIVRKSRRRYLVCPKCGLAAFDPTRSVA